MNEFLGELWGLSDASAATCCYALNIDDRQEVVRAEDFQCSLGADDGIVGVVRLEKLLPARGDQYKNIKLGYLNKGNSSPINNQASIKKIA